MDEPEAPQPEKNVLIKFSSRHKNNLLMRPLIEEFHSRAE